MQHSTRAAGGFTLIELMVALGILMVVIVQTLGVLMSLILIESPVIGMFMSSTASRRGGPHSLYS